MGFSVDVTVKAIRFTGKVGRITGRDEHGNLIEAIALPVEAQIIEERLALAATQHDIVIHNVPGHLIVRYAGLRGPWDSSLEEAR